MSAAHINERRAISAARQATHCRACGAQIGYCRPATVIVLQTSGRTFTPCVCRECGMKTDRELIRDLILQAGVELIRTGAPVTDYLKIVSQLDLTRRGS